jgi:hypothetical protein
MKINKLFILFLLLCSTNVFSQTSLPINFKANKQSVSDDEWFINYYYVRPINISFNGSILYMYYDNGGVFLKKEINQYTKTVEYEDNKPIEKFILNISSDTLKNRDSITIIVDHRFKYDYKEIILPTQDIHGENNYTAYRRFID